MSRPIRLAIGAFVLLAAGTLAAEAALAQRARVYHFQQPNLTWFNPKHGGCPRGMIIRERGEPPRWGYIGPGVGIVR